MEEKQINILGEKDFEYRVFTHKDLAYAFLRSTIDVSEFDQILSTFKFTN